jgi:hypothetical protein
MPEERQRVTLTKAHCETPAGHELIELLAELSADGNVTREEMERLCAWLEVDRGVDFPALPFLYETIDQISIVPSRNCTARPAMATRSPRSSQNSSPPRRESWTACSFVLPSRRAQ